MYLVPAWEAAETVRSVRTYLAADEHQRLLEAARLAPRPADQTFALTLALTGARISEALAVRPMDIDIEATSIRIRTLKRRAEHWREVPVPPELLRALELVHALRSTPGKADGKPLWPWLRATAHRRIARIMAAVGLEVRDFLAKMWEGEANSAGSGA